jgi:hypothetical protein
MYETTGVLRPAVEAYLAGGPMAPEHVAAMRAYLRQWIGPQVWDGLGVKALRDRVDELVDRPSIERWLDDALDMGIDPL